MIDAAKAEDAAKPADPEAIAGADSANAATSIEVDEISVAAVPNETDEDNDAADLANAADRIAARRSAEIAAMTEAAEAIGSSNTADRSGFEMDPEGMTDAIDGSAEPL